VRTDGRHAEVEFGATFDEDLSRRDFTINAIAYSATSREIRDPFGGRKDLAAGVVRAVGEPAERMREDRLRALRGMRFAARFGFEIDKATFAAIRDSASHLTRLSAERVRQELEKTMDQVAKPSGALRLWVESGAVRVLLPELAESPGGIDAVDHAAQPGLARRPGRRLVRLAALFSAVPAPRTLAAATRLRFSKHDAHWISGLVERWQAVGTRMGDALSGGDANPAALRRWVAEVGRVSLGGFFRLAEANWLALAAAGKKAPAARAVHSLYRRSLRVALTEPVDLRDLAVDGDDLRGVGVVPGPGLGKILAALLDRVLDDPRLNTRERLLEEARRLTAKAN
jgi:tRNA nucleotidyltransferase (CCA-adding enzyme)